MIENCVDLVQLERSVFGVSIAGVIIVLSIFSVYPGSSRGVGPNLLPIV
jgi:hypothetical protein